MIPALLRVGGINPALRLTLAEMTARLRPSSILYLLSSFFFLAGCGSPNQANIELRKKNQGLEGQVTGLEEQVQAQRRMIASLQAAHPTTQHLGPGELQKLYVAYGIKFARMTGGADLDIRSPGDEGLRIYITPYDETGQPIQAAGSVVVEAFDLDEPRDSRVGRWEFSAVETRKHWQSLLLESAYVLTCPWQKIPRHSLLTIRVTFTDELTQASFTIQRPVTVVLPSTRPATAPGA